MNENSIEYIDLAQSGELSDGQSKLIRAGGEEYALFYVGGVYYCCSNYCPHQHRSELHLGQLRGTEITCPVHGWAFSLETGIGRQGGKLAMLKVHEEDGRVWAEKPKSKFMF